MVELFFTSNCVKYFFSKNYSFQASQSLFDGNSVTIVSNQVNIQCSQLSIVPTDLGSLIKNTQGGNFRISLPLRFYVSLNFLFDHLCRSEICIFRSFWPFQMWNSTKKSKFKAPKLLNVSFWPSEISHNWIHVKSEWQENY